MNNSRGLTMEKNKHRTFKQRNNNAEYAKTRSLAPTKLTFNSGAEILNNEKENNNNSGSENNNNSGSENNNNSGSATRNNRRGHNKERGRTIKKDKRIRAYAKRLQAAANYEDAKRLQRPPK